MTTFATIIARARHALLDEVAPYRYSDARLLQFANDFLDAAAVIRPELFHKIDLCSTNPGDPYQQLNAADSLGLIEVLSVNGGAPVTFCKKADLDAFVPGWLTATPGAPKNWTRLSASDPYSFMLYPPPAPGIDLVVLHVDKPEEYAAGDTFPLSAYYEPACEDYIVYRCHSADSEASAMARAKEYESRFIGWMGGTRENTPDGTDGMRK